MTVTRNNVDTKAPRICTHYLKIHFFPPSHQIFGTKKTCLAMLPTVFLIHTKCNLNIIFAHAKGLGVTMGGTFKFRTTTCKHSISGEGKVISSVRRFQNGWLPRVQMRPARKHRSRPAGRLTAMFRKPLKASSTNPLGGKDAKKVW